MDFPVLSPYSKFGSDRASANKPSVSFTANNTKCAWSETYSSTPYDAVGLYISPGVTTYARNFLIDFALGTAGNEVIFLNNLFYHESQGSTTWWQSESLLLPIAIPAGSRLAWRAQASYYGSNTLACDMNLVGGSLYSSNVGKRILTYGANTTSTKGNIILDAGGTAHTYGSWVEVTSSLSNNIKGFFFSIGTNSNTGMSWYGFRIDVGVGSAGNEYPLVQGWQVGSSQSENFVRPSISIYFPFPIAAGSRIAMRMKCSGNDATDRVLDAVFYGLVG